MKITNKIYIISFLLVGGVYVSQSRIAIYIKDYIDIYKLRYIDTYKLEKEKEKFTEYKKYRETIEKDPQYGLYIIRELANKGFPLALCDIGSFHIAGQYGIEKNYKIGVELIQDGFKKDIEHPEFVRLKLEGTHAYYNYILGLAYLEGDFSLLKNTKKGVFYLEKASLLKSNEACHILAQSYIFGHNNTQKNIKKGLEYAIQAADRGYLWAQFTIGILYLGYNLGIEQDLDKSIKYLSLASENSSFNTEDDKRYCAGAKYELSRIYFYGRGIKSDLKKSIDLLHQAADLGDIEAAHFLGIFYFSGRNGLSKDFLQAEKYLNIAANNGFASCQAFLGIQYILGINFPKNIEQGSDLLEKAADQNERDAHLWLGRLYIGGDKAGVKQNVKKGIKHLEIAADNGCPEAQFRLFWIYLKGILAHKDVKKAREYLGKSASQGYKEAVLILEKIEKSNS